MAVALGGSQLKRLMLGTGCQLAVVCVAAITDNDVAHPKVEQAVESRGPENLGGSATIDASLSSQFVSGLLMPAALWTLGLELSVSGEAGLKALPLAHGLLREFGVRPEVRVGNLLFNSF